MTEPARITRRRLLQQASLLGVAGAAAALASPAAADEPAAKNKRLKQSIVHWCFKKHWDIEKTCQVAKQLGCGSVEIVEPKDWDTLKKYNLVCALAPSHWFDKGMNNPKYQEMCLDKMRQAVDACAAHGYPNVLTFTGFREDIPDDAGAKNCVAGYKKIIGHAEKNKVNLCLEMLNSR